MLLQWLQRPGPGSDSSVALAGLAGAVRRSPTTRAAFWEQLHVLVL